VPEQELNLIEFSACKMAQARAGPPVMPHAALETLPNAGSCRMNVEIPGLARSSGVFIREPFGIIGKDYRPTRRRHPTGNDILWQ